MVEFCECEEGRGVGLVCHCALDVKVLGWDLGEGKQRSGRKCTLFSHNTNSIISSFNWLSLYISASCSSSSANFTSVIVSVVV